LKLGFVTLAQSIIALYVVAMSDTTSVLVTQQEAARLLGVHRVTIARLIKRGELPTVTMAPGMRRRLRRADVLALAERRTPQADA
jgi:excisionase family DNA binding protein